MLQAASKEFDAERRYWMRKIAANKTRLEALRRRTGHARVGLTPTNGKLDQDAPAVENQRILPHARPGKLPVLETAVPVPPGAIVRPYANSLYSG